MYSDIWFVDLALAKVTINLSGDGRWEVASFRQVPWHFLVHYSRLRTGMLPLEAVDLGLEILVFKIALLLQFIFVAQVAQSIILT